MQYKHLTIEEREKIQELLWKKWSIRRISKELKRSPSSISRELKRNKPPKQVRYTPRLANEKALKKRKSRMKSKLASSYYLRLYVSSQLKAGWSPEQIAAKSKEHIGESISYEAIYQYVYSQIHRGGSGYVKPCYEDLRPFLARARKTRMKKGGRKSYRIDKGPLPSIHDRSSLVKDRVEVGHWEDDSIVCSPTNPVRLRTTNELVSGLILISKVYDRTMKEANRVSLERLSELPPQLLKTLTRDRGSENMGYREIEEELGLECFFADPYCSSQRGANENGNGLVRRFLPKGTDFTNITEEQISHIEFLINSRPRKRLGWNTPYEVFFNLTGVALQH